VAWSEATREFAVIWLEFDASSGQSAVMLQRVDQGGALVGARSRVDINGAAMSADVIWSGDSWIVSFVESVAWAQRLTPEGFLLGAPQRLDAGGAAHSFVRAASGAGAWGAALVRAGAAPEAIVEIRAAGSVGAPLASASLGSTASEPFSVAASSADFVVALSVAGRIDAARIGGIDSGDPGEVLARETVGFGLLPSIEAGLDAAFVAWQDGPDVFARPVSTSGDVVGSQTLLSPLSGVASQAAVGVASDGLVFVAWSDVRPANPENPDIYARILLEDASGECGQSVVLGDIAPPPDGNGVVDVGDVVFALRASVGLEIVTAEMLARGDVAPGTRIGSIHDVIGDGVIDVGDVVVLLQASVSQISLVP
jgi:hypothetical protein